jgi:hypothetical protein
MASKIRAMNAQDANAEKAARQDAAANPPVKMCNSRFGAVPCHGGPSLLDLIKKGFDYAVGFLRKHPGLVHDLETIGAIVGGALCSGAVVCGLIAAGIAMAAYASNRALFTKDCLNCKSAYLNLLKQGGESFLFSYLFNRAYGLGNFKYTPGAHVKDPRWGVAKWLEKVIPDKAFGGRGKEIRIGIAHGRGWAIGLFKRWLYEHTRGKTMGSAHAAGTHGGVQ